ncbi:uncharacterized protein Z520_05059 [Fonsecaea multimorphosa CBS 102226]|uniref:Uncharacterized protein n=1 Tax=Fonsecaea multimorphosa CBS 102226 TaxID=1442371 RepID=A0A0D2KS37_9EURO|nr:uncharacterized protein Z520_05059 [Fonsecaea multimorphosa CBS 102226]KIX99483.1 hypothetical protein Z520_05059 [Fonsecaea multimorphosa CBS 102226]OAL25478.1 hypothetical protein AYO22_04797 [Fonsecaea multimorphosa]
MVTQIVTKPAKESNGDGSTDFKRKRSVTDTGTESNKKPRGPERRKPQRDDTNAHQGSLPQMSVASSKSTALKKTASHVLVSLDPGTEFCKAAIYVSKENASLAEIETRTLERVIFADGSTIVRSQVAFQNTIDRRTGQSIRTPLFGCEVDKALERDEIEAREVIRHFKPMIYKGFMAKQRKSIDEVSELQGRMEKLHVVMEQNLTAVSESSTNKRLDKNPKNRKDLQKPMVHLEVFAQLLRWLLQCAINFAIAKHAELQWLSLEQSSDLDELLEKTPNIHIAIAVPADCSFVHKQHILAAAKSAGIRHPWPYLVSEPAAALEYYLATLREKDRSPKSSYMLVDIGGGSADLQTWSIRSVSPLKVAEMLPAVTEWVGGFEVNGDAVAFLMQGIEDVDKLVSDTQATRIQYAKYRVAKLKDRIGAPGPETVRKVRRRGLTRRMLEEEIAESFEHQKRRPPNASHRLLKVSGVPFLNGTPFCGGFGIQMTHETMKTVYKRSLDTIISTIIRALNRLEAAKDSQKFVGKQGLPVSEILVCGGASSNHYIQREIRKAVTGTFPVVVNFLLPPKTTKNFHLVALGGLLLLANRVTTNKE